MNDAPHRDPLQEFADRIVAELEKGVKPWVRPWDPEKAGGPQAPFNPVTRKRYHGINVLILGIDMRAFQSGDPRWMTYQQAHEKHWQVRKGEKATTIFFTKPYEVDDEETFETGTSGSTEATMRRIAGTRASGSPFTRTTRKSELDEP
jgi:antirestriction protein ArdC